MKRDIKEVKADLELAEKIYEEYSEKSSRYLTKTRILKIELFQIESGLEIDMKVKFMDGRGEKTGVITGFKYQYGGVTPVVVQHRKDGTLGVRERDYFYKGLPIPI